MAIASQAYNALMGMFSPKNPQNVSGSIYDMARRDAQNQALARIGGGLMAAAVPQTPLMRAQALQGAFGGLGDVGTGVYNAAQARLMAQKAEADERRQKAADASFRSAMGLNENQQTIAGQIPTMMRVQQPSQVSATPPAPPPATQSSAFGIDYGSAPTMSDIVAGPQPRVQQQTAGDARQPYTDSERARLQNAYAIGVDDYYRELNQIEEERSKAAQKADKKPSPESTIGKIQFDLKNGLITPEEASAALRKETGGNTLAEKIDTKIGDDLGNWAIKDRAMTRANVKQLNFVLEKAANSTTPLSGPTVGIIDATGLLKFANPDAQIMSDSVRGIAQQSLRSILGSQFTEKEGEAYMNRAWNPALPIEENIRRVNIMLAQLQELATEKEKMFEHFRKYNTVSNYEFALPWSTESVLADFENRIGPSVNNDPQFSMGNGQRSQQQQGATQPNAGFNPDRWGINTQGGRF